MTNSTRHHIAESRRAQNKVARHGNYGLRLGLVYLLLVGIGTGCTDSPLTGPRAPQIGMRAVGSGGTALRLLWQNTSTGDRSIWLMSGTTWDGSSAANLPRVPTAWSIAGSGDFNGDGNADIVWQNTQTGERSIWLMNGNVYASAAILPQVPVSWSIAGVGDFNGDGQADIVWQNTQTGERSIWLMSGTAYASAVILPRVATEWKIAAVGDFNGDGKADLVWQDTVTGQRSIWLMNGTAYAGAAILQTIPTVWTIVGAGDFDGDGKTDLVWQNSTTGQRSLWLMSGTTWNGSSVLLPTVPTQLSIAGVMAALPAGVPPGPPATISLSLPGGNLVAGQKLQLAATALDATGRVNPSATITWSSDNAAFATVSGTGFVTALSGGTVRITAASGSAASTATFVVASSPVTTDWTRCTAAGAVCEFIGLRDVRLGAANGPYVQETFYHTVPCATYGFDNQNPAPNQALHCDYGPIKTVVLNNPQPGMAGMPATVTVGLGSLGVPGPLNQPTTDRPVFTDGSGSFRTTCSVVNFAFDDPITLPGQPGASHLHVFFGNAALGANSTPTSVAGSGNSSCRGGTLNRTGYWAPAVFDTRTGEVQVPDEGVFYYKTGYNIDPTVVQPFPVGLRMIAGNKAATSTQDFVDWYCRDSGTGMGGSIPVCAVGDAARLEVQFPQCWDGVHLDSPDHKSHMSYPDYRNPPQRSTCPASHPVTLPAITEHFDYPVTATSGPSFWRLSSDMYSSAIAGGFSAHADWMNGWDPTTMNTIVTQCLNKAVDCGVGSIGNGTELYY